MNLIISDIDGVIANNEHRMPWMLAKDWDNFYADERIENDAPIKEGLFLLDALKGSNNELIFVTGRREQCRAATTRWLRQHWVKGYANGYTALCMRDEGDFRKAPIVKTDKIRALLANYADRGEEFNHIYFIDDDPENVKMVVEELQAKNNCPITGLTFGIERMK